MLMPDILVVVLLSILVVASISLIFIKNLISCIILFGAYSLGMALVWQQFNYPDIAITEAAVGIAMKVLMVAVASKVEGDTND